MKTTFFRYLRTLALFFAMICFGTVSAFAQLLDVRNGSKQAEIVEAKGDESLQPFQQSDWLNAVVAQSLIAGDSLRTGPYGGLALAFEDRTQIRLHANSRMTIAQTNDEKKGGVFDLKLGRIWSRASKPDQEIIVNAPSATAAIRGTDWFMEVAEDGTTRLVVFDGEVSFYNEFGAVDVPAGASARAEMGRAPELELIVDDEDRPRWALTPRSDWARLLPLEWASDGQLNIHPAWNLAQKGQVRAAVRLSASDAPPGQELLLAYAAIVQRRPEKALELLHGLDVEGAPARLAALMKTGANIDLNNLSDAAQLLARYEADWGEDRHSLIMASWLEAYAGRYDAATRIADRVGGESRNFVDVALLRAQIAVLTGDDKTLASQIALAQNIAPDSDIVWHWSGISKVLIGGDAGEGAYDAFTESAELNPESVVALGAIASLDMFAGRYWKSLETYDRALALDPSDPHLLAGKARTYIAMDRLDLAYDILSPAIIVEPNHPELLSAFVAAQLMTGDAEQASSDAGKVVAARPDRPGAAEVDAVAHWQAGRRDVARKVIGNAVRLDPSAPATALTASIMAQDQYQAGEAVEYARAAWDARERNQDAGLILLPASQNGRLDIGAAFRNLGLSEQGEYYTSLAFSPYDANSAFGLAARLGGHQAGRSSTATGLMLNPLSVSYPNRHAQFVLADRNEQTLGVDLVLGEDDAWSAMGYADANGIFRHGGHPVAYGAYLSVGQSDGPMDNDASNDVLLSLRAGTTRNGRDGFLFRTTLSRIDAELPGISFNPDPDDQTETDSAVFELGYTRWNAWNDRWLLRATGGVTRGEFSNPSALGASIDDLDYSLVNAIGLEAAQAAAARGIFDTALSDQDGFILVYAPFGNVPVTRQLGQTLLPLTDDDDVVRKIETDSKAFSLQSRRMLTAGDVDLSFGAEYSYRKLEQDRLESFFLIDNVAAIVDLDAPDDIVVIDTGRLTDFNYDQDLETDEIAAHAFARWRMNRNVILEGGLFYSDYEFDIEIPDIDSKSTSEREDLDPRIGVALRSDGVQFRLAHQTLRTIAGVDTISPIGVVSLLPTQLDGASFDKTTSTMARLDLETTQNVFISLEAEYENFDFVSAAAPNQRSEITLFSASEAELQRFEAALNWRVGDSVGLSTGLELLEHKILDDGTFEGEAIPLSPELKAYAGASWVSPGFVRFDGRLDYLGERDGLLGGYQLDETVRASVSVAKEARDKSWRVAAVATGALNGTQEIAPGVEEDAFSVKLSIARRW